MISVFQFVVALIVGLLLGIVFFGGLWVTVKRLDRVHNPALWMLASLIVRLSLVLGSLYALIRTGDWLSLVVALGGMLLVRTLLKRRLQPQKVEVTS